MRRSMLISLPLFFLACTPGYVTIGEVTTETDTETEIEDKDDSGSDSREDRCCYTVDMFDSMGDGWDRGFIEVTVDAQLYAKLNLPSGEGYQEICPTQGAELSMYWHSSTWNEEVSFVVYSPEEEIVAQERRPEEGVFFKENVTCTVDSIVPSDYNEDGNIGDVIIPDDPVDPDDPIDPDDRPDPSESTFEGDYEGYFQLRNSQTGYQVCEVDMPVSITAGELSAAGTCYTPNGYELLIAHQGQLEIEEDGWGQGPGGGMPPDFAFGYTYGEASMTVPSGDSFQTEFWGECYQEGGYIGMYLWWEMEVQAPNETRYYQGELQAYQ